MAKIVSSDLAPSGKVLYSFGGVAFELSGKSDSYETDDLAVLSDARVHPWLAVETTKGESPVPVFRSPSVDPADDRLSAQSAEAKSVNNPKAVAAAEKARVKSEPDPGDAEGDAAGAPILPEDKPATKAAAKTSKENS